MCWGLLDASKKNACKADLVADLPHANVEGALGGAEQLAQLLSGFQEAAARLQRARQRVVRLVEALVLLQAPPHCSLTVSDEQIY